MERLMHVCAVLDGLSGEHAAVSAYVLRTLLGTLGLPHEIVAEPPASLAGQVVIWYGRPAPPALSPPKGAAALVEITCLEAPTPASPLQWLVSERSTRRVAVLGSCQRVDGQPLYRDATGGQAVVAAQGGHVRIGADLVATAGFWLTGGEEGEDGRDGFGRFCGTASPRSRVGLLQTPVATDLMNLLWEAVSQAALGAELPLVRVAAWPSDYRFAVLLSHDVDRWRKRTVRQLAKELVRSARAPWRLGSVARAFCWGPDPWSDLDGIADLEQRRGMRSTFFVLPGRPDRVLDGVRVVNSYNAAPQVVMETLHRLAARGWEVGLHGSFESFSSAERLTAERRDVKALAGEAVCGCRQHFLRFERPITWRSQVEAGLTYDATLGYHDVDGYRAGFSFPFHPFDGEELPLLALPLVVMDGALHERQGLSSETAWHRLGRYLERTAADGAMLGLLWHNTHLCDLDAPGYRGVYERALDWTRDHGGWGASARDIAEWWLRRAEVALDVQHDGQQFRVGISAPPEAGELPLELRYPCAPRSEVGFEGCRGRVVEQREGLARCMVGELASRRAALTLQMG